VQEFIGGIVAKLSSTHHNLTSSLVTETGDGAEGTTYLIVLHVRGDAEGEDMYATGGVYKDQFRRTTDGWRIARRKLTGVWRAGNAGMLH
jgi:hypothetical protein